MERQTDILLGILILIGVIIIMYLDSIKGDTSKTSALLDKDSTCQNNFE